MWTGDDEEVRLATQALLQVAEKGLVRVRFVGVTKQRPMYRIINLAEDALFSLEALRRAALMSNTRFTLDK